MLSIEEQIKTLKPLRDSLLPLKAASKKLKILDKLPEVQQYLKKNKLLSKLSGQLSAAENVLIKSLLAVDQGNIIFDGIDGLKNPSQALKQLIDKLKPLEEFYDAIGGIIGYHLTFLELLAAKDATLTESSKEKYLKPPGSDLSITNLKVRKAIRFGIEKLPIIAEIYPVGGAGDRLNLLDGRTGEAFPAAKLSFLGKNLLDVLISDLQAKEYLHYKLCTQQVFTPIVMMTSHEKNNHAHIMDICEQSEWFGRKKEGFKFIIQPLVPLITHQGNWAVSSPLHVIVKPGGHGIIWKLSSDENIFNWLKDKHYKKALVRQINNPISGIDYGLLAFCGTGIQNDKAFGFASCPRLLNTAEGMNALIEKKEASAYTYTISNIEYTDFKQKGIQEKSSEPGSPYSAFPANTNILFVDLKKVESAISLCPFPGMLINIKNKVLCKNSKGEMEETLAGRIETLMQNLADVIVDRYPESLKMITADKLQTFLTFNERLKTISVTKKSHSIGQPIIETPEGCFYDLLVNYYDLLVNYCHVSMPEMVKAEDFQTKGPPFLLFYHPALGPLFTVIGQKIHGGTWKKGTEVNLEIAEVDLTHLDIEGSLSIVADAIVGRKSTKGIIKYGEDSGKCVLKYVKIKNKGIISTDSNNIYWKKNINRHECLEIILRGNGEFFAENVTFEGGMKIEVPDGHRTIAYEQNGNIEFYTSPIAKPTWHWAYTFDEEDHIILRKKINEPLDGQASQYEKFVETYQRVE